MQPDTIHRQIAEVRTKTLKIIFVPNLSSNRSTFDLFHLRSEKRNSVVLEPVTTGEQMDVSTSMSILTESQRKVRKRRVQKLPSQKQEVSGKVMSSLLMGTMAQGQLHLRKYNFVMIPHRSIHGSSL